MERLTIPDVRIDEKTKKITVIDGNKVKEYAMEIYWHLKKIEDILGDDYDLDRLRELVEADREKRCVIFRKGYGMVSFYEKDDEGFVIRTVSGVAPKSDPVVAHFTRRDDSTNEDRVN